MKPLVYRVLFVVLILSIGIYFAYRINQPKQQLPIYNPADINAELVDPEIQKVTHNHKISPFTLVDQEGLEFTLDDTENKIIVADFFFTTCKSICPIMTSQMQRLSVNLHDEKRVMLLSYTVLPEIDSVEVLYNYANQIGANYEQWRFLTGDKNEIYRLARKSFFAAKPAEVGEGDGGISDFIHTNNFVLIDPEKRIRGYYDGTSSDDVDRLMKDIIILLEDSH